MFKNPFSFRGRIRRLEYGLSGIISFLAFAFIGFFIGIIIESGGNPSILLLFTIPIYWFNIAQAVKRSHDVGNSGWWVLVPFYGLYLLFKDGEIGENQYGENPKGVVGFTPPNNPQYPNGGYQNGNNFGGYNGGYNNQQQRQPQQGGSFYNGGHNANNQQQWQQWQQQPPQTTPQQPKGNGKEFDGNLYGKAN